MFRAWVELNSFCSTPVATPHGCVTDGYSSEKDFPGVLSEAIDWWTFRLEYIVRRHWLDNSEYEQKLKRTRRRFVIKIPLSTEVCD